MKNFKNNIEIEISEKYGKYKAKDLAEEYNLTIHQIYSLGKKYKKTRAQNKEVNINSTMNQILLSGIIGDGRLKKNGLHNVIYSECHSLQEADYLKWKFDNLKELTSNTVIYAKNKNNEHSDALEFTTLTTPSLISYFELQKNKSEVIKNLDELGLILLILDDGWFSTYTNNKNGRFCIAVGELTDDEINLLIKQYKDVCNIHFKKIGIKRVDLSASSSENIKILDIALKYLDKDIDVIKKKFKILL